MLVTLLYLSAGAMTGGALRISIANLTLQSGIDVHIATLMANVLGCAIIGLVAGWQSVKVVKANWRHFWQTGFCGGLTTLSLHSHDNFILLREGALWHLALYLTGTLILCLAGLIIAKTVTERVCSR